MGVGLFRISGWLFMRRRLLTLMSSIFFSGIFLSAAASDWLSPYPPYIGPQPQEFPTEGNFPLLIFSIFTGNIVLSAFVFVTLPGFALFPLSPLFLVYRACIWGFLLAHQPMRLFLMAVPTIILEGLGYCFAASAGTIVGLSWTKPRWAYGGEALNRIGAFKKALKECLAIYFFVAISLFIAAVAETITLIAI